ncbi:amidase [Paenarthrobacter sp. RAF54_2]|uniref:amidase n=1 Tax=Paenarthrobacter sp. RAF54_2 TaxID=3233061 RepID=UPI003F9BB310
MTSDTDLPMKMPNETRTLTELRRGLDRGEFSPVDLVEHYIGAIDATAESVNAFVGVHRAEATKEAAESEKRLRAGDRLSAIDGIPFGIKDVIHIRGHVMAAGSRSVHVVPELDAGIITRLRRAGAIILGRTRLHELAYGPSGLNEYDGGARNPRFPDSIPGGSSSGSAAAVAAGLSPIALGTDTGGSIRGPATLCGVVGFKPSYGLLPTTGVLPTAPTMDHVGLLALSVEDVQIAMGALTGSPFHNEGAGTGRRLAIFEDSDVPVDSSIAARLEATWQQLARHGWSIDIVEAPTDVDIMDVSSTIMAYESYRVHSRRLADAPELIGGDVRRRLQDGGQVSREQYERARWEVRKLQVRMAELTIQYDALMNATIPIEAPTIAEGATSGVRRQLVRNTRLQNMLGTPAIALPGNAESGPWSVQLFTTKGRDAALLATASGVANQLLG